MIASAFTTTISTLLNGLRHQLNFIKLETDNIIQQTETAIEITIHALDKLKEIILKNKLKNIQDEIYIFKFAKPQILSQFIYYSSIKSIQIYLPLGGKETIKKYLNNELHKLSLFFEHNRELVAYYRSGDTCMDIQYFTREKFDKKNCTSAVYSQFDHRFTTLKDYAFAEIIANDKLQYYLQNQLDTLDNPIAENKHDFHNLCLPCEMSKIDLIELAYSLYYSKVCGANTDIKQIIKSLETLFNIELGDYSRKFIDIKNRKSNKTKFLDELKSALLHQI